MKIACCISGHVREYERELSSANASFRDKCDMFISTWDTSGVGNIFWKGETQNKQYINVENIRSAYNPTKIDIEQDTDYQYLKKFDMKFKNSPHGVNVLNTLLMFKKLSKSISYVDESYDMIIRSRFDLDELNFDINYPCEDGYIYGKRSQSGNPSDIFFYGNYNTVKKININEDFYTQEILDNCINAEHVFSFFLQKNNITFVSPEKMNFKLHGIVY